MSRRSESEFPYEDDTIIFKFIKDMWKDGWLDEFSDENFLIEQWKIVCLIFWENNRRIEIIRCYIPL